MTILLIIAGLITLWGAAMCMTFASPAFGLILAILGLVVLTGGFKHGRLIS